MKPLSLDLRERIVKAYLNQEGSHAVLAGRFAVSRAVVGKLVRQFKALGSLEPQTHLRGRKRRIKGAVQQRLERHLDAKPDATLEERISALRVDCSVSTMSRTLGRLGWRFKKSHLEPPNRNEQTSL